MSNYIEVATTPDNTAPPKRRWLASHPRLTIVAAIILTVVISSSWLVFPYLLEGKLMLSDVGMSVQGERRAKAATVSHFLTRIADGPGQADVDVLYATPRYFEVADKAQKAATYRPDKYILFVVVESTHTYDLPQRLPKATLIIDGKSYQPARVEGPKEVAHHRATTISFDRRDKYGARILTPDSKKIELQIASEWDRNKTPRTAAWDLPLNYPETLDQQGIWSPILVIALSAGLLSAVLTPCLLQLLIIYLAAITGLSAGELRQSGKIKPEATRRIFYIAVSFVIGFVLLYTAAGAVIGYAGKEAQLLFAEWTRPASIGAGILVVIMGLWVGIKAQAPIVCKIPVPETITRMDQGSLIKSALMAAGFSLGCMACFGGAIIATLLVYVGSLGSASVGAMVMAMFSLGIAIPFLLAAFFLSKALPVMEGISKHTPQIGFVSMTIIIAFGVVLITDNFHVLSTMIYPYLGLS